MTHHKSIYNAPAKQRIKFLLTGAETGGELLEMESTYEAHSKEPAAHYHPKQAEDFIVLSGELTVRMDGRLKVFKTGDRLHIPANKVHSMWNNSKRPTVVNWKVRPALHTEYFLETITGVINDGMLRKTRRPSVLKTALTLSSYTHVFRLAGPPFSLQKAAFWLAETYAWLTGYQPVQEEYAD